MPIPIIDVRAAFALDTTAFERAIAELGTEPIRASVYNDAQSTDGTYYWIYVNNGRGPVRPVKARVLHWVDLKSGKDVFTMYAKGVAPRHIRENSLPAIQQAIIPGQFTTLDRATLVRFVNEIARVAVVEMQSRTPVATGKLQSSYRVEEAT